MKTLLTITICLCLIAALTPPVSAWVNCTAPNPQNPLNSSVISYQLGYACDGLNGTWWNDNGDGPLNTWGNLYTTCDSSNVRIRHNGYQNYSFNGVPDSCIVFGNVSPEWVTCPFAVSAGSYLNLSGDYGSTALDWWGVADVQFDCVAPTVSANFNATPMSGTSPLYVAFQDTSTGVPTLYNWTITPANGLIGNTTTSAYPTIVFTQKGNYTVSHCAANSFYSDCEVKTDYIWVQNGSTDYVSTTFWAVDPLGHRVWDSAIGLKDVENFSWTNTSSPSGGVATITSLFGHTINGYAEAAGYNDGETLGISADGVNGGIILMTPTNITNVSAGYVTLYVYVKESTGNAPISGAYVNLAYAEGGSTRNDGGTTSAEGLAPFVVPKETLIYVYGEKAGYEKVSTTKDSGSASGGDASVSVILYMGAQTITPTVTATTGPGGTVPPTSVTVDPRTPAEKENDIANILIDYGDMLVMFFIALTVIGGVKMIMR